jgi:hypothetical protein
VLLTTERREVEERERGSDRLDTTPVDEVRAEDRVVVRMNTSRPKYSSTLKSREKSSPPSVYQGTLHPMRSR